MAKKFENPHAFETDDFLKVKIQPPRYYTGRIFSKIVRTKYDTSFHVDVSSYLRFINVLKRNDLEAMSAKIPVVSTYHAGIPDVVNSGENGLLAPEKDNQALEQALTTLITHPELRNQFADRALETVRKKHTIKHMKQKLAHLFETL